jgi:hypothetical protein
MSTRKITDLPKKSVSSEQAEDVKGGRKAKKFAGAGGKAKKGAKGKLGGSIKLNP